MLWIFLATQRAEAKDGVPQAAKKPFPSCPLNLSDSFTYINTNLWVLARLFCMSYTVTPTLTASKMIPIILKETPNENVDRRSYTTRTCIFHKGKSLGDGCMQPQSLVYRKRYCMSTGYADKGQLIRKSLRKAQAIENLHLQLCPNMYRSTGCPSMLHCYFALIEGIYCQRSRQ